MGVERKTRSCMQVRVIASERPALQASEGRFAKRIPANIALQDTCLLQASDSRFARYIPANVALQGISAVTVDLDEF